MRTDSSNEFHEIYMHALRTARSLHGDSFHLHSHVLLEDKFIEITFIPQVWRTTMGYHCTMILFLMW